MDLCSVHGLTNVCIEPNSAVVVNMVHDKSHTQWRYVYLIRKLHSILPSIGSVKFVYREQNSVADSLAKRALGRSAKTEFLRTIHTHIHILFIHLLYKNINLKVVKNTFKL